VQLSRARHQTTLYPVVGPEPHGPAELDLPDREAPDGYDQLAQALGRAGDQRLAIDIQSSLDLRRLSTRELRAERDRLYQLLDQAPRDRTRELERASGRRAEADQADEVLGIADLQVAAIVAVHGASIPWGLLRAEGVTIVPARQLPDLLQALPPVLGPERVAWLADRARL
jgi:hypothetical protein